ncbi:MAG TPA: hypothetical protein VI775_00985, partial [Candidatus Paceibacterota bacterium]
MSPPAKVEVAVVDVAWKYSATTGPTTDSFAYGDVVPIPTLPSAFQIPLPGKNAALDTERAVVDAYGNIEAVEDVAVKYGAIRVEYRVEPVDAKFAIPAIDNSVPGDVVPIPILLSKLLITNLDVPTVRPPAKVEVAVVVVATKYEASIYE